MAAVLSINDGSQLTTFTTITHQMQIKQLKATCQPFQHEEIFLSQRRQTLGKKHYPDRILGVMTSITRGELVLSNQLLFVFSAQRNGVGAEHLR